MTITKIINNNNDDASKYAAIIQNNAICQLPIDLFFEILKHLDPITVNKLCSLTCKQFTIILSCPTLDRIWRNLFCLHFPKAKINEIENFNLDYKNRTFVLSNIKNGVYVSHKISGTIYVHVASDDQGRLLRSVWGQDRIEIWDPKSRECRDILLRYNKVTSLAASKERLYVGYKDGIIEILDMKTGQSLNTVGSYTVLINSLAVVGENLIARCSNGMIEILNIKEIETPGIEYQKTLIQDQVNFNVTSSLITSDGKFVSGVCSGKIGRSSCFIVIKDLMSQKMISLLEVQEKPTIITSLACADEILYVGLSNGEIKVVDLKSFECLTSLTSDKSFVSFDKSFLSLPHNPIHFAEQAISLAIVDGYLYANHSSGIVTFDFTKNHDIVFREIAEHLMQINNAEEIIQNAMQRFSRMPRSIRNRIYEQLFLLLKPENHYLGWGEHAFHDQYLLSCSPVKKGEAIMNYLASITEEATNPSPLYPLLQCLKINTDQDYSEQLGCRPGQLKIRGILSLKDLNVICPPSLEIQELSIDLSPADTNLDLRQQQVIPNRNRLGLSTLCNQMLNAITAMDHEAKNCGKILYEGNECWKALQQRLNDFNILLNTVKEKCGGNPRAIIQAFSGDAYAALIKELNTLIREFHDVDCKYRIAKLRAYIHQEVILKVWTSQELKDRGILTLSDFQEKYHCSLRELFHMKEFIERNLTGKHASS